MILPISTSTCSKKYFTNNYLNNISNNRINSSYNRGIVLFGIKESGANKNRTSVIEQIDFNAILAESNELIPQIESLQARYTNLSAKADEALKIASTQISDILIENGFNLRAFNSLDASDNKSVYRFFNLVNKYGETTDRMDLKLKSSNYPNAQLEISCVPARDKSEKIIPDEYLLGIKSFKNDMLELAEAKSDDPKKISGNFTIKTSEIKTDCKFYGHLVFNNKLGLYRNSNTIIDLKNNTPLEFDCFKFPNITYNLRDKEIIQIFPNKNMKVVYHLSENLKSIEGITLGKIPQECG